MGLCKLCNKKKADKTGSHIIPHFIMKYIDHEEGESGRYHELGFALSDFESKSYYGQAVLPEKLDDIIGNISDEDIENNEIPYIVDNYFCKDCEKRFSVFENEYAKEYKIFKSESKIRPEICFMFWISVIWRISICDNHEFKVKIKEERLLQRILVKHMTIKITDFDFDLIRNDQECKKMVYKILRCNDCSHIEAPYMFFHPKHNMPYCMLFGENVLFIYF